MLSGPSRSTTRYILYNVDILYIFEYPTFLNHLEHTQSTVSKRIALLLEQEFLLVFSTLAIYVDYQGRKSREKEIMYPAPPVAIGITRQTNLTIILDD